MLCTSSPHRHFLPSHKNGDVLQISVGLFRLGEKVKLPHCSSPNRLLGGDGAGSHWQALPCALICRQKVDVKLFILALCGGTWLTLGCVLSSTDDCLPLWCLSSPAGFRAFLSTPWEGAWLRRSSPSAGYWDDTFLLDQDWIVRAGGRVSTCMKN